jgi:hypothetical protein
MWPCRVTDIGGNEGGRGSEVAGTPSYDRGGSERCCSASESEGVGGWGWGEVVGGVGHRDGSGVIRVK